MSSARNAAWQVTILAPVQDHQLLGQPGPAHVRLRLSTLPGDRRVLPVRPGLATCQPRPVTWMPTSCCDCADALSDSALSVPPARYPRRPCGHSPGTMLST